MHSSQNPPQPTDRLFKIVALAAIAIVLIKAAFAVPDMMNTFVGGDNDDIMRLMSVRAWQSGQGWFDMQQYRLLPPEGVSIHWSRFIDVAIAGLIGLFALFMSPENAEVWGVTFWPPLLLVAMIIVVGRGTNALLGGRAGWLAVGSLLLWAVTGGSYFQPGRIDHHNVQILMTTIAGFAIVSVGSPRRRGLIAGLTSAFSLAVGLEGLFLIAVIGLILLVRAAFNKPQAGRLLAAFCLSLFGGSVFFFFAQTPPDQYAAQICDELSLPVILVAGVAAVACMTLLALRDKVTSPILRIVIAGAIVGVGLILSRGLLAPCFAGPYGQLPIEVQTLIATQIVEAWGALRIARDMPLTFNAIVTPIAGAVVAGTLVWYRESKRGALTRQQSSAVLQMIVIGGLGLAGAVIQIRLAIMAAPAVGFLTGFVMGRLLDARETAPSPRATIYLIAASLVTLLAPGLNGPAEKIIKWRNNMPANASIEGTVADADCRTKDVLETLNVLPPARILTSLNMGSTLILITHHTGLTAPYHRSAAALTNGIVPFSGDEEGLRRGMADADAQLLVICRGSTQGNPDSFATTLANGAQADWLEEITGASDKLVVFALKS